VTLSFPRDRIRVVLLEGIHDSAVELLRAHGYTNVERVDGAPDAARLAELVAEAHLLGIRSRTQLDPEALGTARRLIAVGCFCIGTNQVALETAAGRGIPVFNAPHSNTRSVAELVIGLVVALLRDVVARNNAVHGGRWPKTAKGSREVRGKTLGIVGYGHIGSQVSVMAEAMGMRVVFHDIVDKLPLGNARPVESLEELLAASDVVTLHVPQTDRTVGMIDDARVAAMRRGAYLINTSRGPVVDAAALARALDARHLAGAAVDVFASEPASNEQALDSPLRGRPDVILTPHVAGSTEEAQAKIGEEVAAKLVRYSDRGDTVGAVNFPELALASHEGTHRILHIHRNQPGVLGAINRIVAEEQINVHAQHLETRGSVGYVVFDIDGAGSTRLHGLLRAVPGTLRTRILY